MVVWKRVIRMEVDRFLFICLHCIRVVNMLIILKLFLWLLSWYICVAFTVHAVPVEWSYGVYHIVRGLKLHLVFQSVSTVWFKECPLWFWITLPQKFWCYGDNVNIYAVIIITVFCLVCSLAVKCLFLTIECIFCWTAGAEQMTAEYVLISTFIHSWLFWVF